MHNIYYARVRTHGRMHAQAHVRVRIRAPACISLTSLVALNPGFGPITTEEDTIHVNWPYYDITLHNIKHRPADRAAARHLRGAQPGFRPYYKFGHILNIININIINMLPRRSYSGPRSSRRSTRPARWSSSTASRRTRRCCPPWATWCAACYIYIYDKYIITGAHIE